MPSDSCIAQRVLARYIVAAGRSVKLAPALKHKVHSAFKRLGLDGNGRFESQGKGLAAVCEALGANGIELDDIINSHILHQPSGRTTANIAMVNQEDSFSPIPIDNSMLALSWQELSKDRYEVLAYLS